MLFRRTGPAQEPARGRNDASLPSRLPLWAHICMWLFTGALILSLALGAMWQLFGRPKVPTTPVPLDPKTLFDALKIALSFVAGIGGVVALVVAYRRQRLNEAEHLRQEASARREDAKLFSERFSKASEQLASDKVAMRLAGVYALAGLADDWEEGRQTCIDVLCAYLRMPYRQRQPLPDLDALRDRLRFCSPAWLGRDLEEGHDPEEEHQVRLTVMRVITDHLQSNAPVPWFGHHFDFTGAVFEDADFNRAEFVGCRVDFDDCLFYREAWFSESRTVESRMSFLGAVFAGRVSFELAYFEDSEVWFSADIVAGGDLTLYCAEIVSGELQFTNLLDDGHLSLVSTRIKGGEVKFTNILKNGSMALSRATVDSGAQIVIQGGEYSGGVFYFNGIELGGELRIDSLNWQHQSGWTKFSGTEISFDGAYVHGGSIATGRFILDGSDWHFENSLFEAGCFHLVDTILRRGALRFVDSEFQGGEVLMRGVVIGEAALDWAGLDLLGTAVKVEPGQAPQDSEARDLASLGWRAEEL